MRPAVGFSSTLVQITLVVAVSVAVTIWVQWPASGLYGYDGHFHIKYSEIERARLLRGEGLIKEFPWWQETFFKDRFADKDFLYHLLLIPFASGDLESAGKSASIVFSVGLYLALFVCLKWCRVPAAAGYTLACLFSSTTLLYRSGLLRSHVLAIALALVGTAAIVRRSRLTVALFSSLYALAHIAWHLLPGIALVGDAIESIRARRPQFMITLCSLAGTAAAVICSPYFPANLHLWWVQNVNVLGNAWLPNAPDLDLGREFMAHSLVRLASYNPGPILFTLAGLALLVRPRRVRAETAPVSTGTLTVGLVALAFFALALMSRRFAELWASMSGLFAGMAWSETAPAWKESRVGRSLPAVFLVIFIVLGIHNVRETRRLVSDDPGRIFGSCAEWIHDHVPPGEIIFTTDWDEFPELFFSAPEQRYLVGLDPTFMFATNPERFTLWRDVVEARNSRAYDVITATFHSCWVFADAGYEKFIDRATQDPSFRTGFATPDCSVYSLATPVDAASLSIDSWTASDGRTTGVTPNEFVDVERIAGPAITHDASDPCARLTGALTSTGAASARLIVSTDDVIRFSVNGTQVFDSAVAAPPTIDEVLERKREGTGIHERRFSVSLNPGYNAVAVESCRRGLNWGFNLRADTGP